ncbi:hypothetical protein H4R21_003099 [Coemansia helicoidea]|uniref:Uncharacterized protein n=1 Tax=Coemansia helicoidea TaxID=1286919 RepID=A0ACC1L4J6_9FUNG|nr:hypothetical protein H4R21_003099 [Coemansia helicoidea]
MDLHARVRVNGEPVDRALLEQCRCDCRLELRARFAQAPASPPLQGTDNADAMVINVALRVFEKLDVTTIALAAAHAGTAPETPADGKDTAGGPHWSIERLVMELYRPKVVVCGLEPLPAYLTRLPDGWRRGLIYLTRHPVRVISPIQPDAASAQLNGLAKVFAVEIEPARPLVEIPACADLVPGISGRDQSCFAALALAACQTWACQLGLAPDADPVHGVPQWVRRGVADARCPWLSYTPPGDRADGLGWHYSAAETPSEYHRVGEWFGGICAEMGASHRMLLIHLPQPVMGLHQYVSEEGSQRCSSDYRALLQSLHRPLRSVAWTFCVFVANIRCRARAGESCAPQDLLQYIPRELWADIAGLRADQTAVAPDLATARQLISARCAALRPTPGDVSSPLPPGGEPLTASSPGSAHTDTQRETPSPLRPVYLVWPAAPAPAPAPVPATGAAVPDGSPSPRVFGRPAAMASSTSVSTFGEGRARSLAAFGSASAASLPLRTRMANTPLPALSTLAAARPAIDVLVVGSRQFVLTAQRCTEQQALTPVT